MGCVLKLVIPSVDRHDCVSWYHVEERGQVHVGFPAVCVNCGGPEDGLVGSDCPPPSFLHFLTSFCFSSLLSSELEWTREAGTENNAVTHVARVRILGGNILLHTYIMI